MVVILNYIFNRIQLLQIHCVNLTGLMKREPLSERLRFANEILLEILDSAENPFTVSSINVENEGRGESIKPYL